MKATGIVRRIDDLGRIVIPKEIRKKLKIKEGESIEVYLNDEGNIVLKKYSEFSDLEKVSQCVVDTLYDLYQNTVLITSLSEVLFVAGDYKESYQSKELNQELITIIEGRKDAFDNVILFNQDNKEASIFPLVLHGDLLGSLIMIYDQTNFESVNQEVLKYNVKFLLKHLE